MENPKEKQTEHTLNRIINHLAEINRMIVHLKGFLHDMREDIGKFGSEVIEIHRRNGVIFETQSRAFKDLLTHFDSSIKKLNNKIDDIKKSESLTINDVKHYPVDHFNFNTRAQNIFKNENITHLDDFLRMDSHQLYTYVRELQRKIPNMGMSTVYHIVAVLEEYKENNKIKGQAFSPKIERNKKIINECRNGHPIKDIAKKYNITRVRVRQIFQKYGERYNAT